MTQTCHQISQSVAEDMLRGLVSSICDRPGQTKAQRDARASDVVHSTLAFQPRDAVELMLAGLTVTHYHLILHTAHDVFGEQPEGVRPRTRSGIVALDRAMIGFVKELHTAKTRPLEGATDPASRPAPEPAPEPARETRTSPPPGRPADPSAVPNEMAPVAVARPVPRDGASATAMMAVMRPPMEPMPRAGGLRQTNPMRNAASFGEPGPWVNDAAGSAPAARTRAEGVLPGLPGGG